MAAVGLAVVLIACSSRPLDEALPTDLGLSNEAGLHLLWINSTDDCLDCQSLDYRLRRIQARWGDDLAFTLAHVGREEDESIAEGFLRKSRLRGEVVSVSPDVVRSYRPQVFTPALVLLIDGAVAWSSMENAHLPRPLDDLENEIAAALPGTGAPPVEMDSIAHADELLLWVPDQASTPIRAVVGRVEGCLRIMTQDPAMSHRGFRIVEPDLISKATRLSVAEDSSSAPIGGMPAHDEIAWWSDEVWAALAGQLEGCGPV